MTPFQGQDQSHYLISQWLREFRPSFQEPLRERLRKGFGQEKIRDPISLTFPAALVPGPSTLPFLPTQFGVGPTDREQSSDVSGGTHTGGGGTSGSVGSSSSGLSSSGSASGPASSSGATGSSSPGTTSSGSSTGSSAGSASGSPISGITPDTGGSLDLGCGECNNATIGDPRLPCLSANNYCPAFNDDASLCGLGGTFCPFDYDCTTSNCTPSCCDSSGGCPSFAVICCYSDNSVLGNAGDCCACNSL